MLNVNKGRNRRIMEACRPLEEYAWLVDGIRSCMAEGMSAGEAVDATIDVMPRDFVVRKFVIGNRAEVKRMCITEYNEAETMELFKEEGREEGRQEGREEGREEGRQEGREEGIIEMVYFGDITSAVASKRLGKPEDEISRMLADYAKFVEK